MYGDISTTAYAKPEAAAQQALAGFLVKVYCWMAFALVVSGVCAWAVGTSEALAMMILGNKLVFWGLIIVEFLMVMGIAGLINRISAATATALFIAYAAVNGLTLSVIFLLYSPSSIAMTFGITAGTFGTMALIGTVTKRDLTSIGNICFMALIGLIIASLVNIFWANSMLYWIVTYAGVLIFVGLTAYDAQKVKAMYLDCDGSSEALQKVAVVGALALYLDFINLMLYLLRIFGGRRD